MFLRINDRGGTTAHSEHEVRTVGRRLSTKTTCIMVYYARKKKVCREEQEKCVEKVNTASGDLCHFEVFFYFQ